MVTSINSFENFKSDTNIRITQSILEYNEVIIDSKVILSSSMPIPIQYREYGHDFHSQELKSIIERAKEGYAEAQYEM
ncbi:hypothetical protein BGZ76_005279, partial [Entomortierella beljakovae]